MNRRAFVTGMLIDAVGTGLYMPFSLLFFHSVSGLSLTAVGAGLTAAGFAALALSPLAGSLIDRLGARRVLLASFVLRALAFACYPLAHSFPLFLLVTAATALGQQASAPATPAFISEIAAGADRDRLLALNRSVRNGGMGVGGVLAGGLLLLDGDLGYLAIALLNAASFAVAIPLILRASPGYRAALSRAASEASPARATASGGDATGYRAVFADRPYLALTATNFLLAFSYVALALAMPVYLHQALGLPEALAGTVFAVNTVLVAALGVPVSRLALRARRTRAAALGGVAFAASFAAFALLPFLPTGPTMIGAVLVVATLYTGAELLHSTPAQGLSVHAAPDHLRGRYLSAYQLSWAIAQSVAPVLITFLLGLGDWQIWVGLGGAALLGAGLLVRLERRLPGAAVHPVEVRRPVPVAA
ncbi:MFS transporter [Longispora fulva]|uniref:MFS family permease n=1 Tax=Longispora fulva TaxID=619741 RepID=A0A8J7GTE3_9ACTN|nr:MFS transporter [Longispora fulva]MBG6136861.1 MFS family permease [Longispora fulva]GIG60032.1 MFS transporter [Longispora fulva]